jgi:MoxR-like ATPase
MSLQSVADVRSALDEHNYLASDGLATAVFLAISLNRPLLLEGEAGVGKTELAKVLATIRNSELIRLQCYEGIDAALLTAVVAPTHRRSHWRSNINRR